MSRNTYSEGKRRREQEKARKKKEKAERKRRRKESGGGDGIPIASAADLQSAPSAPPGGASTSEGGGEEGQSFGRGRKQVIEMDGGGRGSGGGRSRPRPGGNVRARLFVGGLSYDSTDDSLRAAFGEFGEVLDARVILDRDTGRSKGFGFVTMSSQAEADAAMQGLDGEEVDGRRVRVNPAVERSRGPGR